MADGDIPASNSSGAEPFSFRRRRRLKAYLQTESAECGLVCLAMVADFHGHDVDVAGLRALHPVTPLGLHLGHLVSIAGGLGLAARPLRIEMEGLAQLATPCILHWDMKHFVVLRRVTSKGLVIHDPARGVRTVSFQEASRLFTGVALELRPIPNTAKVTASRKVTLRSVFGSMGALRPSLVQILALALVLELFSLASPIYLQWVLDEVLVTADHTLLGVLTAGFGLVLVLRVAFSGLRSWLVAWLGAVVGVQWSTHVVGHLLRLPMMWFEKRHIGDISSRLGSVQTIQRTLTTQFVGSLLDGLMSALTLGVVALYSVQFFLVVMGCFAIYGVIRTIWFRPLRNMTEDQIAQSARQVSELLESIRGAAPIKLANQQHVRRARYENAVVRTSNQEIGVQRLTISLAAASELVFGVGRLLLVFLAARQVLSGSITAGMLIAVVAYADQFMTRAAAFVDKCTELAMLGLHTERLADIVMEPAEADGGGTWAGKLEDAALEVRNLGFRYGEHAPWLFRNQSFSLPPGQMLAIVGPSGCGKTTLAKILLGLIDPTEGDVLFGGVPLAKLGRDRYRQLMGAVLQDDQLFGGTLTSNISFGSEHAAFDEVMAAAKLAGIDVEIAGMPLGYNTQVGDMGSSLSGGQKQRVILARALFRKPQLLVLDEATSHLDLASEAVVAQSISAMHISRVVIAHRPQTIAHADLVLNMGTKELSEHASE